MFDAQLDLVLLDLGLPAGDGEDILRRVRRRGSTVPVIVLTARAEVADRVRGLDAGANDYVTKPFAFEELLARMRAVRRAVEAPASTELIVGDLRLDTVSKVAWRAGRRIDLSPREWALLELFMRNPTRVCTARTSSARCGSTTSTPAPMSSTSTSAICAARSTVTASSR